MQAPACLGFAGQAGGLGYQSLWLEPSSDHTCTDVELEWRRPVPRWPGSSLMGSRFSTAITTSAVAA